MNKPRQAPESAEIRAQEKVRTQDEEGRADRGAGDEPIQEALGFYVFYRLAEDYLIVPRIQRRTLEQPALVSLVAVLIGGVLLGIVGVLVAIPVAAAIRLLLQEVAFPRLDEI